MQCFDRRQGQAIALLGPVQGQIGDTPPILSRDETLIFFDHYFLELDRQLDYLQTTQINAIFGSDPSPANACAVDNVSFPDSSFAPHPW